MPGQGSSGEIACRSCSSGWSGLSAGPGGLAAPRNRMRRPCWQPFSRRCAGGRRGAGSRGSRHIPVQGACSDPARGLATARDHHLEIGGADLVLGPLEVPGPASTGPIPGRASAAGRPLPPLPATSSRPPWKRPRRRNPKAGAAPGRCGRPSPDRGSGVDNWRGALVLRTRAGAEAARNKPGARRRQ